jgi:outer membrane lipoprotein-sorting protein
MRQRKCQSPARHCSPLSASAGSPILRLALLAFVALSLFTPHAKAQPADALDPVIQHLSWTHYSVDVDFTVQRDGRSALKKMMRVIARDEPGGQRILATFLYPQNMKGTSFLAITDRATVEDEYYMYVRTLRRVKRVPNSTENFMLRDFLSLYFMKPRPELWDFRQLDVATLTPTDAAALEKGAVVIEGTPAMARTRILTGYERIRHIVDPARKVILRTEFYDAEGALIRKQKVMEFKTVEGQDVPWRFETHDLREGVRATVEVRKIDFAPELSKDTFSLRYLKRL